MKKKKIIFIVISIILAGVAAFFTNLYCLDLYDYPKIRGNHVGLSMLSFVVVGGVFYLLLLAQDMLRFRDRQD